MGSAALGTNIVAVHDIGILKGFVPIQLMDNGVAPSANGGLVIEELETVSIKPSSAGRFRLGSRLCHFVMSGTRSPAGTRSPVCAT
jgi:hypothetical protein